MSPCYTMLPSSSRRSSCTIYIHNEPMLYHINLLQEKFLCRIRSLEDLLKEERQKVQAVEKRLIIKDGQQSALTDDMKLHEREKEILQQEVGRVFFVCFFNCMFYQLLRVQHSCSSTQSWGSVLPSIVETRDQNSRGCPPVPPLSDYLGTHQCSKNAK